MPRPRRVVLSCLAAVLLAAPVARADASVPLFLPVQGRLLDGADQPVSAQVSLTYSIYDVSETPNGSTPAPALWSATYQASVLNGVYALQLGDTTTGQKALPAELFDGTAPRWMGIAVNAGTELKPRLRLASVPHAFLAQRALRADDAKTLLGEGPASFHDASKLTGVVPAAALGSGATSLTTVGTVTAGTWHGAPVEDDYVKSAAAWSAKLDAVAHDGSLSGDGKATVLAVNYGTTAGTAAAGNDARFTDLNAKFAGYLPMTGGTVSGNLAVAGIAQFSQSAFFQQGVAMTGNASASGNGTFGGNLGAATASVTGDVTVGGNLRGTHLSTGRSYVGLEHDILLNATTKYTVTQSGPATLDLPTLFDGAMGPSYSAAAPTAANPQVITIDGLPGAHVQAGAVVGFSTRGWGATKFKVEIYDTYSSRNVWRTVGDTTATGYTPLDWAAPVGDAVVSAIRITVYEASGTNGRLGISEVFFLHAEVSSPYAGLIPQSEVFSASLANPGDFAAPTTGAATIMRYTTVIQNTNDAVFQVNADGSLTVLRAGVIDIDANADVIVDTGINYAMLELAINGAVRTNTLAPYTNAIYWTELVMNFHWKAAAGDVLALRAYPSQVKSMDPGPWSTLSVKWTGLE